MRRHYDTEAFLTKLDLIREVRTDIEITTDIIVGYPTETEDDFLSTLDFSKKARFSHIHVFPFSSRPMTFASTLKDIDPAIKKDRVARLIALSDELESEYNATFDGREVEVLVEDQDKITHKWKGHTSNYLLVSLQEQNLTHGDVVKAIYKIQ